MNARNHNSEIQRPRDAVSGLLLFLDSADPGDWEEYLPLGFFRGVTTNPLLLERAGQPCTVENLGRLAKCAGDLGAREIQMQTWGETWGQMTETGNELAQVAAEYDGHLSAVIKVPATGEGFRAARALRDLDHEVTLTAVYTPGQVLLAAGLGAAYAAPYLGRLVDAGQDGPGTVLAMQDILRRSRSSTRLLTASLRSAAQVVDLVVLGLDTFTFGTRVAAELVAAELTTAAAADFQRAAEAMGKQT